MQNIQTEVRTQILVDFGRADSRCRKKQLAENVTVPEQAKSISVLTLLISRMINFV